MTKGRLRVLLLALTDLLTFYLVLIATAWIYQKIGGDYPMKIYLDMWGAGFILIVCNAVIRLYQGNFFYPGAALSVVEELRRISFSTCIVYLLIFAYLFASKQTSNYSRFVFFSSCGFTIFLLPIIRWMIRSIMKLMNFGQIKTLIVGAGKTGMIVARELQKDRQLGLAPVGFVDDFKAGNTEVDIPVLGKLKDAILLGKKLKIKYVIIAVPLPLIRGMLDELSKYYRHIVIVPTNDVLPSAWLYPCDINGFMGLEIRNQLLLRGPRAIKWCLEMFMAAMAVIMLFPLFILLAIAVKLTSKGPIFYQVHRLGLNGQPIRVYKFRTMHIDADKRLEQLLAENPKLAKEWREKFKLKDDPRVTRFGNFLRRTSLDELPQFWNVLIGEMAVIGPRPIVESEKEYYGKNFDVFCRVKPGITGLWQVSGRSNTDYEQRVFLDIYYIMNWSPWLDYFIFLKTIKEILFCRGAY